MFATMVLFVVSRGLLVTIVPHQENWPNEFQKLGAVLRQALSELALRIDHIGSTAVSHLPTKDRIDMQVTVAALTPEVEQALNQISYTRFALLFRDFLRNHDNYAQSYAEVKRMLAAFLADADVYPEVKQPSVELIYFAAEKWAAKTAWQPGVSDA